MMETEFLTNEFTQTQLENFQKDFFSISGELFLIANPDGSIKWINSAWESLLGYTFSELQKTSIFSLINPKDIELSKNILSTISKPGNLRGTELRIKNKDGKYHWFLWNTKVSGDENLLIASGKDITQHKESEEELRLLKSLVFAFNELGNLKQSLNIVLKEICEFTEWPFGEAWVQENDSLIRLTSWYVESDEIKRFVNDTKEYKSKPGHGIVGNAWISQKPVWIENLSNEKKFYRSPYLMGTGLNSYFVVPIISNQEVVSTLAFFQYGSNKPNTKLISLLSTIISHLGALIDHKNVEERLIQNEKLIREIEKIANTGSWEIDFKKEKIYWSDGLFSIYGTEPKKIVNPDEVISRIHPEDREKVVTNLDKVLKEKKPFVIEYKIIRPDGSTHNLLSKGDISTLEKGIITKMVGITQDITTQKEAETKLKNSHEQLKRLSAHLQTAREEERTHISREIHDELGQSLTGLKMDLAWIERKLKKNDEKNSTILEKITSMSQLIDSTIQSIRRISSELRPGVLDYLGLPAAIEWQAQDFQNRTGITCKVNLSQNDLKLTQDLSTAVFRIFQETLTNVARHSKADLVEINLKTSDDFIILEVKDNGKGITDAEIMHKKSLGLVGMQERAEMFGGKFKISGSKNGTIVLVQIPLPIYTGDI
jgi:PAS domain S-box-containing protein